MELEPGVSNLEVAAEGEREASPPTRDKQKRKHPGRQSLPADLPRVERVIACTPEQCVCGNCGGATTVIGYEQSEQLDVEPAKYFVLVTRREKRACKCCEEQGVAAAPLPERIIEKSLVSDGVIIDTIVGKYCDHSPLYRQSVILLRDAGIDISRATMCGWVMTIGEMLLPVVGAMRRELLRGTHIQADETPVDVQMHDGSGTDHQAYLWQYGTPAGAAVFEFRMDRGREGPARFLGNFEGLLQTDDYAAYDRVGGPKMVHAACWAHARRRFVEAVKLNPQDVASVRIVVLMDRLFAVDAQAREEKMDHAARHALRRQHAPPLLDQLRTQILTMSNSALPKSAAGKACSYTLALWQKLTAFAIAAFMGLRHGEIRGLLWENYRDGEMPVSRSIWNGRVTDPKTRKGRAPVPVIRQLAERLEMHRLRCRNTESEPIFANAIGKPLALSSITNRPILPSLNRCERCDKSELKHQKANHEYKRDSRIPEWHGWHAARRGLGSNLYRLGVPDMVIQRILRHANVSTTPTYDIKTAAADVRTAMATLENHIAESIQTQADTIRTPDSGSTSNRSTVQ